MTRGSSEKEDEPTGSARGETAWREARERVADRNAKARKAGREQREAYDRQRVEARRARELRQMADLLDKSS
jgi:hypothetical protein